MDQIPGPAKERLLHILRLLEASGTEDHTLTSSELEELCGWSSHTIRKDISFLGTETDGTVGSAAGYASRRLIPRIKEALGLDRRRKFCVAGLGRLGSAYLNLDSSSLGEFELAAGFDINVNRVEILRSPAPLYPAYKMGEVIGRLGIEIALLCVPAEAAQETAEKLSAAGIRGIINFVPRALVLPDPARVAVRNVFVTDELRALAVKMG
ncbi:MAG: CoA-binding protein [Spirochaetaceae bacterium]|jgi:redox-sensing transcriptional repressor|nr:CoA-binding protein [Spirochaetaceae bacterium]